MHLSDALRRADNIKPLAWRLLWGEPNSIKRTMKASTFVDEQRTAGNLKDDAGYGWPVEVEQALNRCPLANIGECAALILAGMGDMVPSQVTLIEDVRADLRKRFKAL